MEATKTHQTLIVANLTAATPFLLQEIERRAQARPTAFSLLIPSVDPRRSSDWSMESALRLLSKAAGTTVNGLVGGSDEPFESVQKAVQEGSYDDIVISTLPKRTSEWLKRDLPTRVQTLGLPVDVVTPPEEPSALAQFTEQFSAKTPSVGAG